jgi:hypothetical protein
MLKPLASCVAALTIFLSAPAFAQSSFTSVSYAADREELHPYSGARFFSEDGINYRFRAFGCEFEVQYPFQGDPPEAAWFAGFMNTSQAPGRGWARSGLRAELTARLVHGRLVQIGSERPAGFSCETAGTMSLIAILTSVTERNGKAFAWFYQQQTHPSTMGNDPYSEEERPSHSALFVMEENFFTPNQERQMRSAAWSITQALLEAWVQSRH